MKLAGMLVALGVLAAQDAGVHLKRGGELLAQGRPGEAATEFKKAVALEPRSAAAHQLLGQAYLAQGAIEMIAEAQAEFQQALDLDPNLIWSRFYLAKIYLDLGRLERAQEELERGLKTKPDVPHFLSLLGEVSRRRGDPSRAIELNARALAADPSMTPAHYYRALAWQDLGNDDEARRELELAIQSKYVTPEVYIALGALRLKRDEMEAAGGLFQKAIALDPRRPEGHLRLGEVYRRQRAFERALAELKLAAVDRGRFLSTEYYQKLEADVWYETGRVYEDWGRREQAVAAYRRALEADPGHARTSQRLVLLTPRQEGR